MLDPLTIGVGFGLLGALVAGPAAEYGLQRLPQASRRSAEWMLLAGTVVFTIVAGFLAETRVGVALVYVLAALPGLVAYLAFRTLLASLIVTLAPLYFVIGALTRGRPTYVPEIALDRAFGVQPEWVFVYGSLYLFVIFLPLVVVRQPDLFRQAMKAFLMVMLVSYAGFWVYPTLAPRPAEVFGDGFAAWSLRLTYSIDPPHGCFPSLHVAYSFVSALTCSRVHRGVGIAALAWAALIGVSTLYTKQHYAVDVIAGTFLAYVAYWLFLRRYPRDEVTASDRIQAPFRALAVIGIFAVMIAGFWVAYRTQTPGF